MDLEPPSALYFSDARCSDLCRYGGQPVCPAHPPPGQHQEKTSQHDSHKYDFFYNVVPLFYSVHIIKPPLSKKYRIVYTYSIPSHIGKPKGISDNQYWHILPIRLLLFVLIKILLDWVYIH